MKKILFPIIAMIAAAPLLAQKQHCPEGSHLVGVNWEIEKFNLHRPATGCTSGFGFCLKTSFQIICAPDAYPHETGFTDDVVRMSGTVREGQLELRFPIQLKDDPEFKSGDMGTFSVTDGVTLYTSDGKSYGKLRTGDYPVTESERDLVVLIDIDRTEPLLP